MKNKKFLTDEQLDSMLTEYFNREPRKVFSVNFEKEEKSMKKIPVIKYGTIGVCTAALLAAGIFSGQIADIFGGNTVASDNDTSAVSPLKPNSFTLTACADEVETADSIETAAEANKNSANYQSETGLLGGHFVTIAEAVEYIGTDGYAVNPELYDGEYTEITVPDICSVSDYLKFTVSGDNIVSYSAVCEKGQLGGYIDVNAFIQDGIGFPSDFEANYYYNTGANESDIQEYAEVVYVSGDTGLKETGPMAYASPDECKNNRNLNSLTWHPSNETIWQEFQQYADEISMYDDEKGITGENLKKYGEYKKQYIENLLKDDNYNNMFSDTITITVNYADGTSDTQQANVTFDQNGHYIVDIHE